MKKFTINIAMPLFLLLVLIFTGCSQPVIKPQLKSEFDQKIDRLILETVSNCRTKISQNAPVAIVSKALLEGKNYTRLDEMMVQRMETRLASDREIINLSRENWFELRESKPFSLNGHPSAHADFLDGFIVFIVDVEPDEIFEQIKVSITAKDAESRKLSGVKGQTMLNYDEASPGTLLLKTSAKSNPLPLGLKENPYGSMEQLCYSMASELSFALKRGINFGKQIASDDEIQVVLCSNSFKSTNPMFKTALIQELQQALVSMDGMTCAVSREDVGPVFKQIDFYQRNNHLFEIDNEKFKPGSVLLMAQTKSKPYTTMKQVALRAVWRVSPLTDKNGGFVPQNISGTYVSGFTSRAWFNGEIPLVLKNKEYIPQRIPNKMHTSPYHTLPDKGFD
ncbi:hypothetical protein [Desulfobacula toluolica]|uniref:Lipoprotein n=1 Tax=Desulfobacula toluolica (strain DSM 7467 / Tol2) TaxID=651182 RepID=K0NF29_DESTT|nr:hypothetical protein [Desulfobacula toluolica]CCK78248.1 uncharacterized protein TOL2_C00780 [Desulfobacula toluolica Tol2]